MLELFAFVGLPYAAITVCIVGIVWRFKKDSYGITSLSSQFLEGKKLLWGSAPWHFGILIIFFGHLVAFLLPGMWQRLMAVPFLLAVAETVGIAATVLSLIGLSVLFFRRLTTGRLQKTTNIGDFIVTTLLLGQVVLGLMVALGYRWGADRKSVV